MGLTIQTEGMKTRAYNVRYSRSLLKGKKHIPVELFRLLVLTERQWLSEIMRFGVRELGFEF